MGSGCCSARGAALELARSAGSRAVPAGGVAAAPEEQPPGGACRAAAAAAQDGTEVVSFTSSPSGLGLDEPHAAQPEGAGRLLLTDDPARAAAPACGPQAKVVVRSGIGAALGAAAGGDRRALAPVKKYSIRSEQALNDLSELDSRLSSIEGRVGELAARLQQKGRLRPEELGRMKTELAQLEAEAHKLESNGVDNVYTSELSSGRLPAKETKKCQLQRLEVLFERVDEIFASIQTA